MRKLQPLRDAMKGPSLHPAYLRVLRELGEHLDGASPSWIAQTLRLDAGYTCRILSWFRRLGYLDERAHPQDGRSRIISLSARGQAAYSRLELRAQETAELLLMLVRPVMRNRLLAAMGEIDAILGEARWDDVVTCPSPDRGCG